MNSKSSLEMGFDHTDEKNVAYFSEVNQKFSSINLAEAREHSMFENLFKQDECWVTPLTKDATNEFLCHPLLNKAKESLFQLEVDFLNNASENDLFIPKKASLSLSENADV